MILKLIKRGLLACLLVLISTGYGYANTNQIDYPLEIPGVISSGFTYRRLSPFTGRVVPHLAVDIAAPPGTIVKSAIAGKVIQASWNNGGYGNLVIVENPTEQTLYAHMLGFFVHAGDDVIEGQPLGRVGSTGYSTGPHLHFAYHIKTENGWLPVDPLPHIQEKIPSGKSS